MYPHSGQFEIIGCLAKEPLLRSRLLSLGLTLGARVAIVRSSMMTGLVELMVRGTRIMLRQAEFATLQLRKSS